MFYVYILESIETPKHFYIGYTNDLKARFAEHNAGKSRQTNKYRPWKIKCYTAFENKDKAEDFEMYLKTHAGRRFQKIHF